MALLGANDLKNFTLPVGWDGAEMAKYLLADGTTYEQLVDSIAAGLAVANASLINDPVLGGMISTTAEGALEYRSGAGNGMSERTEYQRADAKRGATGGHSLPIKSYGHKYSKSSKTPFIMTVPLYQAETQQQTIAV